MRKSPVALSTGQAARYCCVTADTILNWIKGGRLPASRTLGGQYRVLVGDLRDFMLSQGVSTTLLDETHGHRSHCWDYCHGQGRSPLRGSDCDDCLVRRAEAWNCFELRCAMSHQPEERTVCSDCQYLSECRLGARRHPHSLPGDEPRRRLQEGRRKGP